MLWAPRSTKRRAVRLLFGIHVMALLFLIVVALVSIPLPPSRVR